MAYLPVDESLLSDEALSFVPGQLAVKPGLAEVQAFAEEETHTHVHSASHFSLGKPRDQPMFDSRLWDVDGLPWQLSRLQLFRCKEKPQTQFLARVPTENETWVRYWVTFA